VLCLDTKQRIVHSSALQDCTNLQRENSHLTEQERQLRVQLQGKCRTLAVLVCLLLSVGIQMVNLLLQL